MNLLFLYQLIILFLFNFNLESVNCIVVTEDINLPLLLQTATIAPPPLLVLPNPTIIAKLTDPSKPYRAISHDAEISDDERFGHGNIPIHLQTPPQHEPYQVMKNDKTYIEQTLSKYEAQHSDKLNGDNKKLEHKSSKNGGKHFHLSAKGAKGESTKDKHHKQYEDKGGKEHEDYDEDSKSHHHHNHHGGAIKSKFHKKNSDNKRRSEKGFHNKYRKNEHHKLDDFFKNYNENGEFVNYGLKNTKHNKVYKNSKKGARKSQKGSESKVQKKGPKIIKLTVI